MQTTSVLGCTADNKIVAECSDVGQFGPYSFRFFLTPCCLADATGVSWGTGVACRACYAELPEVYGGLVDNFPLDTVFGDGIPLDAYRELAAPWLAARP